MNETNEIAVELKSLNLKDAERTLVLTALCYYPNGPGVIIKAARLLGISRYRLRNLRIKYNIERTPEDD